MRSGCCNAEIELNNSNCDTCSKCGRNICYAVIKKSLKWNSCAIFQTFEGKYYYFHMSVGSKRLLDEYTANDWEFVGLIDKPITSVRKNHRAQAV